MNFRFPDVLLCLYYANLNKESSIGRIQLQKFIYLADTMSIIWDVLSPKHGHVTYKYGPWDRNIQNAVDALAFRGFLSIDHLNFSDKGSVEVLYKINNLGIKLISKLKNNDTFKGKIELYEYMAAEVTKRNWNNLIGLVYNDPAFLNYRREGYGYNFDYLSPMKNDTLRILYDFEKMLEPGKRISKRNMVSIFFKILE